MKLPFSHDAFLDVFGAYNSRLWPVVALLWAITAGMAWGWLRHGRLGDRSRFGLLAAHWAWSGVAYHWFFFRRINPAAGLFAAVFVLQAAIFTWLAIGGRGHATAGGARRAIGAGLVVYGLVYPLVGFAFGLDYPRLPLFAVPCPTALVTAGFLVATPSVPRFVSIVPIAWAVIGSSAAFALEIPADWALVPAGALLVLALLVPATRAAAVTR